MSDNQILPILPFKAHCPYTRLVFEFGRNLVTTCVTTDCSEMTAELLIRAFGRALKTGRCEDRYSQKQKGE